MALFKGSGVAIVTPFERGRVNYRKLAELIEWHIASYTDSIIICGTTGEASALATAEKKKVIEFTVKTARGRIPVFAGTGSNNTTEAVAMSRYAEAVNADGLLVVTPYHNRTTQSGLFQHFAVIAAAVNIPIILYNVPARTGVNLLPETVARLAELPAIQGIKEASGNISQVAAVARLCSDRFHLYSGNDDQIVPVLSLGGSGVISVIANILPRETHDLVFSYFAGRTDEAKSIQLGLIDLINILFIEPNPIPIKTAMNLLGMGAGELRLPLAEMETSNKEVLRERLLARGFQLAGGEH